MIQKASSLSARKQGFRVAMSRFFMSFQGKTLFEGPIMVGVACNVKDVAAIKALIEADPQAPSEDNARGTGEYIRGLFVIAATSLASVEAGQNNQAIEVKYGKNGWSIPEDQELVVWAYNMNTAALTTGVVINWYAEHYGVWLRD